MTKPPKNKKQKGKELPAVAARPKIKNALPEEKKLLAKKAVSDKPSTKVDASKAVEKAVELINESKIFKKGVNSFLTGNLGGQEDGANHSIEALSLCMSVSQLLDGTPWKKFDYLEKGTDVMSSMLKNPRDNQPTGGRPSSSVMNPEVGLPMHDLEIYPSCREMFVASLDETIDKERVRSQDKIYIAKWTNRVALWRFFERFYRPIVEKNLAAVYPGIELQSQKILAGVEKFSSPRYVNEMALNPFSQYGHAFNVIFNAWMPVIRKMVRLFEKNTRDGFGLKEDFYSSASIAFLYALEKHAMGIISSNRIGQGIPFPKRLVFSIKKEVYADIPNLTGPVKVPIESEMRKTMPIGIGLDDWLKYESGGDN